MSECNAYEAEESAGESEPSDEQIFTTSLATAHRAASRIDAGYVWVNSAGGQALGTPYGGMKQSGYGRDKVLEEMISHTVLKNIAITL